MYGKSDDVIRNHNREELTLFINLYYKEERKKYIIYKYIIYKEIQRKKEERVQTVPFLH